MLHIKKYSSFLNEQSTIKLDPKQMPQKSDRLGKGGSFETSMYGNLAKDEYFKLLKSKKPEEIKKVRLIFPSSGWEVEALKLIKSIGLVTGVFTNLDTAKKFILGLVSKGVKADELVIGSHGTTGALLMPKEGKSYHFDNSFLESFKPLVHKGTKVFFTACHGADYLDSLKDASEKIGVPVYGSAGIYDYLQNDSEKGFYVCFPGKVKLANDVGIKAYSLDSEYAQLEVRFGADSWSSSNFMIEIDPSIFGETISPIGPFHVSPDNLAQDKVSQVRSGKEYLVAGINLRDEIEEALNDRGKYNLIEKKIAGLPGNDKYSKRVKYISEAFKKGLIRCLIVSDRSKLNVTQLPDVIYHKEITNKSLLAGGYCRRYESSPVNWFK